VALSFLDGVVEAEVVIPSGVSILVLCPRYYGVGSDVVVEQEVCVVQEYTLRMWQMEDGVSYAGFVDEGRQF
jgi:hypothetical protein